MDLVLTGPTHEPLSCGKPLYLVLLLHAPHEDGNRLIELACDLAPTLGKAEFVALHAPFQGRWRHQTQGFAPAAAALEAWLANLQRERALRDDHIALIGFGEGADFALYAGLHRDRSVGALVAVGAGDATLPAPSATPPLLLVGSQLPACLMKNLVYAGLAVEFSQSCGDYHLLDEGGVERIAAFVALNLDPARRGTR